MRTELCKQLGIEIPIFAFTHCRDVVVEVSKAGGLGVLGAVDDLLVCRLVVVPMLALLQVAQAELPMLLGIFQPRPRAANRSS